MSVLILLGKILFVILVFATGFYLGFKEGWKMTIDTMFDAMMESKIDMEQCKKIVDSMIKRTGKLKL